MILVNSIICSSVFALLLILRYTYKSLNKKPENKFPPCDFNFSKTKFKKAYDKKFAEFSIKLPEKNQFFDDFPLMFRFYGDSRFLAKIKIRYEAVKSGREPEEIVDKVIQFEANTIECKRRITDLIVGEIKIEIELKPYYGTPIIEFEILKNEYCELRKPVIKIIKFPKRIK